MAGCSDFNSFELIPSWPELFLYCNYAMMRDIYSGSVGDINVDRGNLDCVLGNGGTVYLVLEFWRQTGCQYPRNIHKTYLRSN